MRMERVGFNVRYALRQFGRNRGFAVTVVLTIALGIGLNTAMFSVIRAVLLQPLGYADPDRLVTMTDSVTPVQFEELRDGSRLFAGLGAYLGGREELGLSGNGVPEALKGARVSANFLEILGVAPAMGRGFFASEDRPGGATVAMISTSLWRRKFGADPAIVGKTMTLGGVSYTIIGVLPAKFQFPFAENDFWLTRPSEWSGMDARSRPISPILHVFGRLRPGVDMGQAEAEIQVLHGQYAAGHPAMLDAKTRHANALTGMKEALVADAGPKLWLLFGAVGLVLLLVCANIASLLLARATARGREFAVRAAVGAGRGQIMAQLLTESLLLALAGGGLGLGLAEIALRGMRGVTALDLPRADAIGMDGQVLLFALAASLLTGLVFGLAPSMAAARPDLGLVLRGSGEGVSSGQVRRGWIRIRPRSVLVVGQVAISTVLLIGAALLVESLARVYRVDPGFEVGNLLTMQIALPAARYGSDEKRAEFYDRLVESLQSLPGVKSAAIARTLPMTGWAGTPIAVTGRAELKLNERPIGVLENISPGYLKTMGIALKRGREFTAHDDASERPVTLINESMARRFWPEYPEGESPIGAHLVLGTHSKPSEAVEIVGIVADIRQSGLDQAADAGLYLPAAQQPPEAAMLAVRTAGNPMQMASAVRARILMLDRDQPVSDVATMRSVVDDSEGELRVMMTLLAVFAGVASVVAVIGLYGVIAYSVAQRTKEMGIRRALGAGRGDILSLVAGRGLRLALIGVLVGLGGAFALTRVMHGLLFEVSATDPLTYAGIGLLFVLVGLAASYFPARRAAAVDPMETLRGA